MVRGTGGCGENRVRNGAGQGRGRYVSIIRLNSILPISFIEGVHGGQGKLGHIVNNTSKYGYNPGDDNDRDKGEAGRPLLGVEFPLIFVVDRFLDDFLRDPVHEISRQR